jgi:hypothetical protein
MQVNKNSSGASHDFLATNSPRRTLISTNEAPKERDKAQTKYFCKAIFTGA